MLPLLVISVLAAFLTTFWVTPHFMKWLQLAGVVALDLQKKDRPLLPSSGGICVAFGVLSGLLTYIGLYTAAAGSETNVIPLLAVTASILIVMFVGLLDDLNVSSKAVDTKEGRDIRVGFSQWLKPLLTFPAAVPLMAISAGQTVLYVAGVGTLEVGSILPLLLIPLGVVGASNVVNLLAGFNGVEAGMATTMFLGLGCYSLLHHGLGLDGVNGAVIFLIASAASLAFLRYNWFPAKILPGDSLTYLVGAVVASGAVVGHVEVAAAFALAPYLTEFVLKLRARFQASCLGRLRSDGTLESPYGRTIYSCTHIIMNVRRVTEKQVAVTLILVQAAVTATLFLLLR